MRTARQPLYLPQHHSLLLQYQVLAGKKKLQDVRRFAKLYCGRNHPDWRLDTIYRAGNI
jgi:hypothetical protein